VLPALHGYSEAMTLYCRAAGGAPRRCVGIGVLLHVAVRHQPAAAVLNIMDAQCAERRRRMTAERLKNIHMTPLHWDVGRRGGRRRVD